MIDPFEQFAEDHISAPRKARIRAAETRAQRKREKELDDREIMFREWQKWHQKRKAELLTGAWGEAATELADFLERMDTDDAVALIELVERGPWRDADADTRFMVLELIDHSIIYLREREGLEPFDDPLDDDLNAFLIIRGLLQ
jgi:hypothetical protein